MTMLDLSTIKPSTTQVEIRHPGTGKLTGLVLECTSFEADAVKAARREIVKETMRVKGRKRTPEEQEEDSMKIALATVVGWEWRGDAAWGGKKLEFTPENVRTVLSADWILKQLSETLGDEAAFFTS